MNGWIVETLVSSTVLMLVVLVLRRPVARLLGAHTAYALWALPALRLLLPPLPGWTTLFVPVANAEPLVFGITDPATAAALAANTALSAPLPAVAAVPPTFDPALVLLLLVAIWVGGALAWFGWQILRYLRFMRHALADAELLTRVGGIEVLITGAVTGPLAAGIRRRRILLPADFARRYTAEERRLAVLHEGAHHDRGDLLANLAGLAVVAVHWWNPVAHLAYRAFRRDQELACDASVIAGAGPDARVAYGSAVLKSACSRAPAAACAMNHKSQLKQRIAMMKTNTGTLRASFGAAFAVALIGGGLLLSASGVPPVPPVPSVAVVAPVAPAAPIASVVPPAPPLPPHPARAEMREADARGRAGHHDQARAKHDMRIATADAERAGREAAAAGERAGREAQAMIKAMDIDGMVKRAMAAAQTGLTARCTAAGVTVPAAATMDDIAHCDRQFDAHIKAQVRESLRAARQQVAANPRISGEMRRGMLEGLDEAIRDADNDGASPTT